MVELKLYVLFLLSNQKKKMEVSQIKKEYNQTTRLLYFLTQFYEKLQQKDNVTCLLFEGENIYVQLYETLNRLYKILQILPRLTKDEQNRLMRLHIFINRVERIFLSKKIQAYHTFGKIRYHLDKKITSSNIEVYN